MNYSAVSEISGNGGVLLIDTFLVFPFLVCKKLQTGLFLSSKRVDGDVLQCTAFTTEDPTSLAHGQRSLLEWRYWMLKIK